MKHVQTDRNPIPSATILVVDDDRTILRFLSKCLQRWGYRVMTADSGRRAIARLASGVPDVVMTDLYMPDGDGFDLLSHVSATAPDLPVIILSGQGDLGDAIRAIRMGAWDYVSKPLGNSSFLQLTIERVLEKARLIAENQQHREHLEELVAQKSAALLEKQKELMEKTVRLEQTNTALKLLVDQREIEKQSIEQTMVNNLKRFVLPYLDELSHRMAKNDASHYLAIIRTNIEQLIAPVSNTLSGAYLALTPTEIKVADLIRQGRSTKAIADQLNTSPSTVEKHRNKIRSKLNIRKKKINLQTYLNSLA